MLIPCEEGADRTPTSLARDSLPWPWEVQLLTCGKPGQDPQQVTQLMHNGCACEPKLVWLSRFLWRYAASPSLGWTYSCPSESCRALESLKGIIRCCVTGVAHSNWQSPVQSTRCLQCGFVLQECLVPVSLVFLLQQGREHRGKGAHFPVTQAWGKRVLAPHLAAICALLQHPAPGNTEVSWEHVAQKERVRRKQLSPGLSLTSCNDTDIGVYGINFLLEVLYLHTCQRPLGGEPNMFVFPGFPALPSILPFFSEFNFSFSIFFPHIKKKSCLQKKVHYFPNSRKLTLAWLLIIMSNTLNEHPQRA